MAAANGSPTADAAFAELLSRIRTADRFANTGDDPIYYLIFPAAEMLPVKRRLPAWLAKLASQGWQPEVISLGRLVNDTFRSYAHRQVWLESEKEDPFDFASINASLKDVLVREDVVARRILAVLESMAERKNGVIVVTDIEALHPYLRIGAVEQRLHGKASVPVVILYPGTRAGKATLKFLGIYPEDGNYRSIHIGG